MSILVNRVRELANFGQAVWVDELRRSMLRTGALARLVEQDGVCGVTSNPTILQQAIAEDESYREELRKQRASGATAQQIYENLALEDVREAADQLRRVYRNSDGVDGFVSFEVSPHLATDTSGTVAEAKRLWRLLDRPNVMIKVPATDAGLPAARELIAAGINVNVTLLFSVARYREVVDAFASGMEDRRRAGESLRGVASVASLFVSRIDTFVDRELRKRFDRDGAHRAQRLIGQAGVEVARFAYQDFKKFVAGRRWMALAASGARPQRLLWASTSTKDAAYSDVKYIDALIGPQTVTTVPLATLAAFRDHGKPAPTLQQDPYAMATVPAELLQLGIDLEEVGRTLEADGLQKFMSSYDALLASRPRTMP